MNTNDLLQAMLRVAKSLENSNYLREADKVSNLMIRVAQGSKWYDPNGKFYNIGRRMKQEGQTVPGLIGNAIVGDLKQSYKGLVPNQSSEVKTPNKKSGIWWKEQLKTPISDPGVMVRTLIAIGKEAGVDDAGSAAEIYLRNGPSFKNELPLFIERSKKVPSDGVISDQDMLSFLVSRKGTLLIDYINDTSELSDAVLDLFVNGPATSAKDGTYDTPMNKLKQLQGGYLRPPA
jgi:hypothetical protein